MRIRGSGSSEAVLVVEDEDSVMTFLSACLKLHGFHVVEARSACECLSACASFAPPGLFVIDVLLPGTSGAALAASLARRFPDAPALFISGLPPGAWPESVRAEYDALPASNRMLLLKPFQAATLLRAVDALMPSLTAQS